MNNENEGLSNVRLSPVQKEIVCGLSAGTLTILLTHPLDLIKVRLQLSQSSKPSYRDIIKNTIAFQGQQASNGTINILKEAYRGLNINLLGNAVSWGLYFGLYRFYKDLIHDNLVSVTNTIDSIDHGLKGKIVQHTNFGKDQNLNSLMYLGAAWGAGITTSVLTNPIWVIKTRMMGSTKTETENYKTYRNISSTIKDMVRKEGLKSFTKGLLPSILGVSQGAIYFSCYDTLKIRWYHSSSDQVERKLGALDYIMITSLSKMISVTSVYPLQLVKSNLQYNKDTSLTIIPLLKKLYNQQKTKSWRNFYKGLSANLIRAIPSTCITFYVYENLKHSI